MTTTYRPLPTGAARADEDQWVTKDQFGAAPQLPLLVPGIDDSVPQIVIETRSTDEGSLTFAPETVEIGSVFDPRLRLRRAISLSIAEENGHAIVHSEELDEFGYGSDVLGAVDDFRLTIAELYSYLNENRDRLSIGLASTWEILEGLISEA